MREENIGKSHSSLEPVIILDRQNRVIGSALRWLMRRNRLIHRTTYIIIHNSENVILVQKRTLYKDIYPDLMKWPREAWFVWGKTKKRA